MSLSLFEAIAEVRDPLTMIHEETLSPEARTAAHTVHESGWYAVMEYVDSMTAETRAWLKSALQEMLGPHYHVTAEWVPHHRT